MNSIFKIIIFTLLVSAVSIGYASDFRIGVVDTERILRESAPAVQAEKKIEKEFELRDLEM
jgi:outer membrane protein